MTDEVIDHDVEEMAKKPRMNPADKALWTAALRSGKYKQGQGWLKRVHHRYTRHCCLGVFAELKAGDLNIKQREVSQDDTTHCISYNACTGVLPEELARLVGTSSGFMPFRDRGGAIMDLASANDAGVTFKQIADLIDYFF